MAPPPDYIPGFVCHIGTCNLDEWGYVHYIPSLAGNALFLAIFAILAILQIWLGVRYKAKFFCVAMTLGLTCEAVGYIGRVLLSGDPFWRDAFLIYLICLTIAPAFIAAAIYVSLGRVVIAYGVGYSRIRPKTYTSVFMSCDIISLVIQAVGGGIAASAAVGDDTMLNLGTHILVAGLAFQVFSLFVFCMCGLEFARRVKTLQGHGLQNPEFIDLVNSKRFKYFLVGIAVATLTLFIRTVFRSIELSGGFKGKLAQQQVEFMILDGVMVIVASVTLTALHPGFGFQGRWNEARFAWSRGKKNAAAPGGSGDTSVVDVERDEKVGTNVREHASSNESTPKGL